MGIRRACRIWHKWFGILAGGWLLLLAVTGIAIAWYDELDRALNPDLRKAIVDGPAAPLEQVLSNAEQALPGWKAGNLLLASPDDGTSHWLIGRQAVAEGGARTLHVFVDPASASVLGWREAGVISFHRHYLPDLIYGLHIDFLAGETGAWLVGIIGLLWALDHFLSLPLAFPTGSKWRDAFRLKGKNGSLRRLFDWHRAKGMWFWIVGLTLAVTGVTLTFPVASRDIVEIVSPISGRLHETMADMPPPDRTIDLDQAVRGITDDQSSLHSIRIYPEHGVYAVRTFDPRDVDDQGRLWSYVRMDDGSVTGSRHDIGSSAGDLCFAWQYPLHSGRAFGVAGQIIISLAGLVTIWLWYSGIRLWLRRRSRVRP